MKTFLLLPQVQQPPIPFLQLPLPLVAEVLLQRQ